MHARGLEDELGLCAEAVEVVISCSSRFDIGGRRSGKTYSPERKRNIILCCAHAG